MSISLIRGCLRLAAVAFLLFGVSTMDSADASAQTGPVTGLCNNFLPPPGGGPGPTFVHRFGEGGFCVKAGSEGIHYYNVDGECVGAHAVCDP
jgi:hypothetical protein